MRMHSRDTWWQSMPDRFLGIAGQNPYCVFSSLFGLAVLYLVQLWWCRGDGNHALPRKSAHQITPVPSNAEQATFCDMQCMCGWRAVCQL